MISPHDILDIKNPLVANEIAAWKEGKISLEQALVRAVVNLARNNAYLMSLRQEPLVAAAKEALELQRPVVVPREGMMTKARIEYFQIHGHWPEGAPAQQNRTA